MYICICNGIRRSEIVQAVRDWGCHTLEDVRCELGVATCCGKCADDAEQVIDRTLAAGASHPALIGEWLPESVAEASGV